MSIVPYEQDSEAWHLLRSQNVGGSECGALFDVQPAYALSRYALWHVKAGNSPAPEVSGERVFWGLMLEQAIAQATGIKQGWTITKGGYAIDDTTPGLGASLDYTIQAPGRPGLGVLEVKSVDWMIHKRSWTDAEPPPHILLQLQHQLAAAGCEWGAIGALVGGNDLRIYEYQARPKLIADIRRRVTEFWASIREGREPPVDGSDGASAVLRALHPDLIDEEIDLTGDNALPDICARLLHAGEARREAEREEAEAKNQLAAKLGDCRRAKVQGFRISVAVTPEKEDRVAEPGEIIKGRKEARRINCKELVAS